MSYRTTPEGAKENPLTNQRVIEFLVEAAGIEPSATIVF